MGIATIVLLAAMAQRGSIDLPGTAARVPVVLESLSKLTDQKLSCSAAFNNRVVYVESHGLTFGDVRQGMSSALDGKWVRINDTLVLEEDGQARSERRAAFLKASNKRLQDTVKDIRGGFPKDFDVDAALDLQKKYRELQNRQEPLNYGERETVAYGSPVGRLLFDVLASNDFGEAIADGGASLHLYSNDPGGPFARINVPVQALRSYDKEQAKWDELMDSIRVDGMLSSSDFAAQRSASQLPAGRVCLAVGRYGPSSPTCVVSMVVYDDHGNLKGIARFNLFFKEMGQLIAPPTVKVGAGEQSVELSEQAKKYLASFAYGSSFVGLDRNDPLYSQLLDPVKYEPLGFWVGDAMRGIGSGTHGSVFASLDDVLYFSLGRLFQTGTISESALEAILTSVGRYDIDRNEKYTVVRQLDPQRARRFTLPRELLGRLLREIDKNGYLSLSSLIEWYGFGSSPNFTDPVLYYHTRAIVPGYERLLQFIDKGSLGILSSIQPDERQALLSGHSLTFGALSPTSQTSLNRLFESRMVWQMNSNYNGAYVPGELQFPLSFPNGLVADLKFVPSLRGDKGIAVWNAAYDNSAEWMQFDSPRDVVGAIAQFAQRDVDHKFWYGDAIDLSIGGNIGTQAIDGTSLFVPLFDLRKAPSEINDLPEDLQKLARGGG